MSNAPLTIPAPRALQAISLSNLLAIKEISTIWHHFIVNKITVQSHTVIFAGKGKKD